MSRVLFGILLVLVGLLYIWLAFNEVQPGITSGNWVSYLEALFFLVTLLGAAFAGMNLVRAKRR